MIQDLLVKNLAFALPKGALLGVVAPSEGFCRVLDKVCSMKKANVMILRGSPEANAILAQHLVNSIIGDVDLFVCEPSFFTPEGGLFVPSVAELLVDKKVIGVGGLNFFRGHKGDFDFVPLEKAVTEKGVFSPGMLFEIV